MDLAALEAGWVGRVAPDPGFFGWEPFDLTAFVSLLTACLPHVPAGNRSFVDAGCGIGTKCLTAADAGLAAYGIDRVPQFVAEATRLGVTAELADARTWDGYGRFGLVYVNHPLNRSGDSTDEAALEQHIHDSMTPGSVLLAVNYDLRPGCVMHDRAVPCTDTCPHDASGWRQVARSGAWHAAWVKP